MFEKPLFILDIANNHMGSLDKGLEIIQQHHEVIKKYKDQFNFAFKFQYRNLDSYIHKNYKNSDHKYVKRFSETKLSDDEYLMLKDRIEELGYYTACTPFDEISAQKIEIQNFDIVKISSASMCDWSLFEEISKIDKPIIMSTAGASRKEIDNAVLFFQNRNKDLKIMHCIAEYPTKDENLQLNQIDLLKKLYPNIEIGFSTHEDPQNVIAIEIAIGKGCKIFERHIDINCETKNAYSAVPYQIYNWLYSAKDAFEICGVENQRHDISEKEISDLTQFKRGVFVNRDIEEGEEIKNKDIYFAWPSDEIQMLTNEYSKYDKIKSLTPIKKDESLSILKNILIENKEEIYKSIIKDIGKILLEGNVHLPETVDLQLSHHYGIDQYYETGVAIIECILHDEYAKKLLVMLPNQAHPKHTHIKKSETFQLLHGDFELELDGGLYTQLKMGETFTVERGRLHGFSTINGCVFEEVSTASLPNDSIYEDQTIMDNYDNRKTMLKAKRIYFNNK